MEQAINISEIPVVEMIRSAIDARRKAYAPYSGYAAGAALLTNELRIYTGCNIENASYTPTICAERTAICKAVSEGWHKFKAIAIVGSKAGNEITQYAFPCGVCRQVMCEFVNPAEFLIVVAKSEQDYKVYRLDQLLPESFGPDNLS